jgi:hypothetical protein
MKPRRASRANAIALPPRCARYPASVPCPRFSLALCLASWASCLLVAVAANADPEVAIVSVSNDLRPWVRDLLRQGAASDAHREAAAKLREDLARDEIQRLERALQQADESARRDERALGGLTPTSRPVLLEYDRSPQTQRQLERRHAESGIREARQELRSDQISDDLARSRQQDAFVQRTERLLRSEGLTRTGARSSGSAERELRRYQRDRALGDQLRQTDRFVNDR